ncbi:MAG: leucine--tRNA ligase [Bacteroidia bacterium]|nr:leucine--tRNA ligase [Bacteroidia bacterium]
MFDPKQIDAYWQQEWAKDNYAYFHAEDYAERPKFYILDMFPFPSGSGLHVGHPLGYIATDIIARYKRLKGYNVLHPMGWDAFGLPAEQYAIETGIHPAISTQKNIETYKRQLNRIGLGYDWQREINTTDPQYYKWTQWIFLKIYNSWFDERVQKARPIESLIQELEQFGNQNIPQTHLSFGIFDAHTWNKFSETEKHAFLSSQRLAYLADVEVNWCPALGTVLANEEVKDGLSERGGHPVERIPMKQWIMRITAYAPRLLEDLKEVDWPESIKEMQRNWIGQSQGAEIDFPVADKPNLSIKIFTTRPDTICGATFMILAPEHELVPKITTAEQKSIVEEYIQACKNKSERERIAHKTKTGVFTGAYAINPINQAKIPVYIADYVIATYGTGAIMCVPAHDERDYEFAKMFNLPIIPVLTQGNLSETESAKELEKNAYSGLDGTVINSTPELNGLTAFQAQSKVVEIVTKLGIGKSVVNYKLRDWLFSRQRYWGEPFPIIYKNGLPYPLDEKDLPVLLPDLSDYKPTGTPEPPLSKAKEWMHLPDGSVRETNTMPNWAGSCWYYLRYLDPHNPNEFVDKEKEKYWMNVDVYVGGAEHAVLHLLYARFWHKVLYDLGYVSHKEPFQKLINQGMILGVSEYIYKIKNQNVFVSYGKHKGYDTQAIRVNIHFVKDNVLDIEKFKQWRPEYKDAYFICDDDGTFKTRSEVEKMSKTYYNVVNPDEICDKYGADAFRLYEMFLGPLTDSKPWNTNGIDGVYRFLKKLWRLFYPDADLYEGKPYTRRPLQLDESEPTLEELKVLHSFLKKCQEDIEQYAFNTVVSAAMICVNELGRLNCRKRAILEPFIIALSPFAPHICEELWFLLGHKGGILKAQFPEYNSAYLVQDTVRYPIQINGKVKVNLDLPKAASAQQIEELVLQSTDVQRYLQGKLPKKVIVVPNKIVNIVV